jgi:hypothetical protein
MGKFHKENREKYCKEAFELYGVKLGDKIAVKTDSELYRDYNNQVIEITEFIGADSDYDDCALPMYKGLINGLEAIVKPEEITSIDDSILSRYFNDGDIIDNNLVA